MKRAGTLFGALVGVALANACSTPYPCMELGGEFDEDGECILLGDDDAGSDASDATAEPSDASDADADAAEPPDASDADAAERSDASDAAVSSDAGEDAEAPADAGPTDAARD